MQRMADRALNRAQTTGGDAQAAYDHLSRLNNGYIRASEAP
jgi:hypothetical protein